MKFSIRLLSLLPVFFSDVPTHGFPGDEIYQRAFLIEDARKSIELPEGYSLQLVLSEPHIEEPVAMAWDGNGVLYVREMRTYMQTADATGEQEPKSRICAMRTPMVTELMTRAPCLSTICSFPAWSCLSTTGSWSESPTRLTTGTTAIRTGTSRTKK